MKGKLSPRLEPPGCQSQWPSAAQSRPQPGRACPGSCMAAPGLAVGLPSRAIGEEGRPERWTAVPTHCQTPPQGLWWDLWNPWLLKPRREPPASLARGGGQEGWAQRPCPRHRTSLLQGVLTAQLSPPSAAPEGPTVLAGAWRKGRGVDMRGPECGLVDPHLPALAAPLTQPQSARLSLSTPRTAHPRAFAPVVPLPGELPLQRCTQTSPRSLSSWEPEHLAQVIVSPRAPHTPSRPLSPHLLPLQGDGTIN